MIVIILIGIIIIFFKFMEWIIEFKDSYNSCCKIIDIENKIEKRLEKKEECIKKIINKL